MHSARLFMAFHLGTDFSMDPWRMFDAILPAGREENQVREDPSHLVYRLVNSLTHRERRCAAPCHGARRRMAGGTPGVFAQKNKKVPPGGKSATEPGGVPPPPKCKGFGGRVHWGEAGLSGMKKVRFLFPVVLALSIAGVIASAMMVHILTIMLVRELAEGTWRIKTLLFGTAIAFLAFLLSLMYLLFRSRIQKPLSALVEYAQRFAGAGDGTARAKGHGKKGKELEMAAEFPHSNPNLIMTVTRDGRIVYANRSVERMLLHLGIPGQHYELLLPDETREIVEAILSGEEKDRRGVCKTMGRTIDYTAIRLEASEAVGFYGTDGTRETGDMEAEKALSKVGR